MTGAAPAAARETEAPETPAAPRPPLADLLRHDGVVFAAMLAALGLFYLLPWLPLRLLGWLGFLLLTLWRPRLHLAVVPLVAPLFYRQQPIDGLYFPLPEIVILTGALAWGLRDGWTLLTTRRLPDLRRWLREPGVWLAVAFGLIGTLWLLVPPTWDLRKVALREFRWTVAEPLLYFALLLRWARAERDIWRIVAAWLVGGALLGREGVEQFFAGEAWTMEGVARVSSVYPSATAFGIYLGRPLAVALVLAALLPREWKAWRIACALLAAVMSAGLVLSFTRGAWIGVFAGLAVAALVARHRALLVGLAVAVLAGLAALPFVRVERITSMFDFSTQDNTGVARGVIWRAALNILRDHPFAGIGQDQFLYQDPRYGVPQMRFFLTSHPHNWVLDFWLRLGLAGLVWIVAALGWLGWQAVRLWQRYRGTALGALVLGLLASLVDFAVHGLLDMAYFTMDLAVTFWLTAALLVLLKRTED